MSESDDKRVIVCNLISGKSEATVGALAYLHGANEFGNIGDGRIQLFIRSRGGRWIEHWYDLRDLDSFRFKTLPPEHPMYKNDQLADYWDQERLDKLLSIKQRFYPTTTT